MAWDIQQAEIDRLTAKLEKYKGAVEVRGTVCFGFVQAWIETELLPLDTELRLAERVKVLVMREEES